MGLYLFGLQKVADLSPGFVSQSERTKKPAVDTVTAGILKS
jgi:hypothetical protein